MSGGAHVSSGKSAVTGTCHGEKLTDRSTRRIYITERPCGIRNCDKIKWYKLSQYEKEYCAKR